MIWNKLKNNNLNKLTVENLEIKMNEERFDKLIIEELLGAFKTRMTNNGEQEFQRWLSNLHLEYQKNFKTKKRL